MKKRKRTKFLSLIITLAMVISNFIGIGPMQVIKADTITVLSEGFDSVLSGGGTTTTSIAPTDWVFKNIGGYASTSTGYYGNTAPSIKFGTNGSQVTTPSFSLTAQGTMSFWIRGASTDNVSDLKVEKFDGTSWIVVEDIKPLPTVAATKTYNLEQNITQIRFTYTKSGGNVAFDDFRIVQNTAPATVNVNSVSLNSSTLNLGIGKTAQLTATIDPANATNKNVSWSSDKPDIAVVNNGLVTGVSEGTATITVTTEDGSKTSLCVVTVSANAPPANKTFDLVEITDFHGQLLSSDATPLPVGAVLA
ncbi:Ig-like domain-containing protein, partial [Candidatus Clostridium stratigraminis]